MLRFTALFAAILFTLFAGELTPAGQALVRPWTAMVAEWSALFATAIDGTAGATGNLLFDRSSGFAIAIEAGCNGVEATLVLIAGVLAYPSMWREKGVGILAGLVAIQGLNIVRIVSLFFLGQWDREWFEWAHLYVWQSLIMLDAFVVWLFWVAGVDRRDRVQESR